MEREELQQKVEALNLLQATTQYDKFTRIKAVLKDAEEKDLDLYFTQVNTDGVKYTTMSQNSNHATLDAFFLTRDTKEVVHQLTFLEVKYLEEWKQLTGLIIYLRKIVLREVRATIMEFIVGLDSMEDIFNDPELQENYPFEGSFDEVLNDLTNVLDVALRLVTQ